ncbi:MAG TPA: adenosylcobinamide amidohydrolase [Capillimicrobium sp.]|nr:adenosylcobinamide amidohydrolase [Capillimicrobium sp.]
MPPAPAVRLSWPEDALLADFRTPMRCVSSAALNGGLAAAGHWLALQVGAGELGDDPALRLAEAALALRLDPRDVVGMLTTADVRAGVRRDHGDATAVAAVAGDVAVLLVADVPLGDAALVAALQTATTAAGDALAATRLRAAAVSVCVAAPPARRGEPARLAGALAASIGLAVHGAVRSGARIHQRTLRALGEV